MKRELILCNGFGFDNKYWDNILHHLNIDNIYYFEQGKPIITQEKNTHKIAMGHSLGFLKICQSISQSVDSIIGLNAFTNFIGSSEPLRKKRNDELSEFTNHIKRNHKLAMQQFYKRCGIEKYQPILDVKLLLHDCETMKNICTLPQHHHIKIINSKKDPIVPIEITNDNFKNQPINLTIVENGIHDIGYNESIYTAKLINEFLDATENNHFK